MCDGFCVNYVLYTLCYNNSNFSVLFFFSVTSLIETSNESNLRIGNEEHLLSAMNMHFFFTSKRDKQLYSTTS